MLSSYKYPKDPSCPSDYDERPYDKLKAVDLSTSDLEKGPKFSIRDYVFFTRNKDNVNNWPFSQNNMQLCLKHGVKNLLPPFESPNLVRNLPHAQDNVDKRALCEPSSYHFELIKSTNFECEPSLFAESNPSVSETDKESEVVTQTAASKKRESIKKCRLMMKYSNIPHSKTKESTTVMNAVMSSETVSVCPVCKTFSSSSNTTLNAHIDQCLSGEYTTKSAADFKVNRNKIKPRKIRFMVDIYKTASYCTLEELDRRNGSNWAASNRTISPPEVEIFADSKGLCLNVKDTTGDGSVYVDSSGTKLRILSKFGNLGTISSQPRKLLNNGKGSMGILAKKIKKMRNQIKKQQKCLRLVDKHGYKLSNGQDGIISPSRECMEGNLLTKPGLSSLTNSHVNKFSDLKFPIANSPGKSGQIDNSSQKAHDVRKRSLVLHELSGASDKWENGSSYHKRAVKIRKTHVRNADNSVNHSLVSKTKKLSSLSKKLSSASNAPVLDSGFSRKRKFPVVKKFKVISESESDKEETLSHSGTNQSQDLSVEVNGEDSRWGGDTSSEEESYNRSAVRKVRSSRESIIMSREEEVIELKSSLSHSHHEPDSWNENVSSRHNSDNVSGQFTRFSNSVEVGYLGLPGLINSQSIIEEYILPYSTDPVLTSGQDIFCENLISENMCMTMVDQIPIPGPPGSFLPSPRHMNSDDLQGNSSLTSTRVQSLDVDHHDFADQSSQSRASDISTVSNSNIRRSGSEPSDDVVISASTIAANVVETYSPPKILTEIPSHPCCCSRKEVSLNYHDSSLLQRRTMGSIFNSCCGTQPNGTLDNSRVVYNDNDVRLKNAEEEESVIPPPSTPVLRLMGKNMMVMNKNDLIHSMSNSAIALANLQAVYGNYEPSYTPQTAAASHNIIRDDAVSLAGTSKSDPQSTSCCFETQEYVYGRPVRSLVDSSGLVRFPDGSNSEIIRWNCTLETSNVPLAGSSSSGAPLFRSELLGSSGRNQ